MKHFASIILFYALVVISNSVYCQHLAENRISSRVDEVTVYLNGAELRSTYNVDVKQGTSKLIFTGLSPYVQEKSVQVTANGSVELSSVTVNKAAVRPEEINKDVRRLMDSMDVLRDRIQSLQNQVDSYEAEKSALKRNEYIGGSQSGVSLVELSKAADFFRERTLKINNALTTIGKQLKMSNDKLDSLQSDYNAINSRLVKERKEVSIVLNAASPQKVEFILRYLVSNTGWAATYDLISKDVNEPVTLKYKAQVYNNTAIDWRDVKLTLSTADPTLGASKPYLTTWILNYTSQANEGLVESRAMSDHVALDTAVDYETVAVSELSTSFPITKPYSIPATAEPYLIEISSASLKATYEYLTIPKVDLSAFLVAKVTGWEKLSLIDGNANVYFGNTYIGESRIDTRLIADTLELSLGRDNQIVVTRAKLEDQGDTKFIGTRRTESFTYEIQLKNNHKTPVTVRIQDQLPVSQENEIVVDVENISGASLDAPSGRLQWVKNISAGESIKYRIAFSVKYPRGRTVAIRQRRSVRTPRYRH